MTRVVVTGYASLDYAMRLDRAPQPDATATILARPLEWPRLGGSPAYIACAMVASGLADVKPLSWIGDDADGRLYRAALTARNVAVDGIALRPGRTPICILAYQPDGGCHCFYDPSLSGPKTLDEGQRRLVAGAEWVCLTVGPTEATAQALAAAKPEAKLVWAVKADRRAVPPELAAAIAARADVVAYSRGEAPFVAEAFKAAGESKRRRLLIETRGRDGVLLSFDGHEQLIAAEPLASEDTTGAGDTFLGGLLAALVNNPDKPADAVEAGGRAARAMLVARG
ncbi:carbohydrate kinase family protein [Methylocapsa sp. S129]|uniref:carbohydrate kinase family protein n=1 Tax=Methylocapsa sp. S129 TaxID=1641869 RepID=UPI00131CB294|nr:carbohydrate kinase family protein [Methylocapsa sp. S129]